MIAKVPVHRGSLLKSIENLLKTIESSENAVMIPTLLRDKVRVDAWELLFVAKILKASILGHSDLVEFYMNHIGYSSLAQQQQAAGPVQGQHQAANECSSLSPSGARQPSPMASPLLGHHHHHQQAHNGHQEGAQSGHTHLQPAGLAASPALSSAGSLSSVTTTTSNGHTAAGTNQSRSTASWITASQQQNSSSPASLSNSSSNSFSSASNEAPSVNHQPPPAAGYHQLDQQPGPGGLLPPPADLGAMEAARPLLMRQAQPPSLLQLTTTNNHINSVAANFNSTSIEQLTNQLTLLQAAGGGPVGASPTGSNVTQSAGPGANGSLNGLESALSISTGQQPAGELGARQPAELRPSRSAGCLFRANSGASSPRTPAQTPTTPYPQAETLANGQTNGLVGDPSAPVKLLLQIEQLKVSISHVTTLLDSVVELYKKSVDNIAQ